MGNKMGKMKAGTMRAKLLQVVGCVMIMWLSGAPCSAQPEAEWQWQTVEPWNVDSDDYTYDVLIVWGTLNLNAGAEVGAVLVLSGGTVNMYPGANVLGPLYVDPGTTEKHTTVNFRGGDVGYGISVPPDTDVTVYGYDFIVDEVPCSEDWFIPKATGSVLTGFYENGDEIYLMFDGEVPINLVLSAPAPTLVKVAIDIKPGSDTNPINLKSNGVVPVAVLTTESFNAAMVDPATVDFAGAVPVHCTLEDVDGDGNEDMLLHFRTQELNLDKDSTEATLTGETTEGVSIQGTDAVQIVPSKPKK
jgi:hypothetical protein